MKHAPIPPEMSEMSEMSVAGPAACDCVVVSNIDPRLVILAFSIDVHQKSPKISVFHLLTSHFGGLVDQKILPQQSDGI